MSAHEQRRLHALFTRLPGNPHLPLGARQDEADESADGWSDARERELDAEWERLAEMADQHRDEEGWGDER